jgi:hypothetical protein
MAAATGMSACSGWQVHSPPTVSAATFTAVNSPPVR